jgi:hypothetical protein
MARGRRITVRLADWEIQSVRRFADENHLLPSVAVRWLLNGGLGSGEPSPAAGLSDEVRKRPRHDEIDRRKIMIPRRSIGEDCS